MKLNQKGIDLIKSYEKLFLRAYDDFQPKVTLTANTKILGTLTIGYGSTGKWIKYDTVITEEKANQLLKEDIAKAEIVITHNKLLSRELNDNQYSAIVSFTFNTGGGYVSNGKWKPYELWTWINNNFANIERKFITTAITSKGKKMQGLINRRTAESNLYFTV